METISAFVQFVAHHNGIGNKAKLTELAMHKFGLAKERSVYCHKDFSVRFSHSAGGGFSNTVLSLSNLRKYDDKPFLVCLVTATENKLYLANTTFLAKISHSSQELRLDNIRGSFNGSDIIKTFDGTPNDATHIQELYALHADMGFDENLPRLVEATNGIAPTGRRFVPGEKELINLNESVARAVAFCNSVHYQALKADLDARLAKYRAGIVRAANIANVNIRGRAIEYLISGDDDALKARIAAELDEDYDSLPEFKTENTLGDYSCLLGDWYVETDIKTKKTDLGSAPKAYNVDKFLEYHSWPDSVFMFYFIGVDDAGGVQTALIPVFQTALLAGTKVQHHWAGRNSRGVTQFDGAVIQQLLANPDTTIDAAAAMAFLTKLVGNDACPVI
jgi:hypothetical protein